MVEGAPILPVPETPIETPEKEDKKDKGKEKKKYGILAVEKGESKEREEKKAEADKAEAATEAKEKKSPLHDTEPVSEEKAPTEELGEEEGKVVVRETAGQMLAERPEVSEEAEPEEAAAELAAQEFLAEAAETGDAEEALEKAAAKLEVTPEELAAMPEAEELEIPEISETTEEPLEEEVVFDRRAEAVSEDVEEDLADPANPAIPPPPSTPPPVPPGGQPPFAPLGGFGHPPGGGPHGPGLGTNSRPAPAAANTANQAPQYHETSPAAMALFGGIIGYLIGRRRGRIKTEKRLVPVQNKLEKQVADLQFDLQEKEKKIRRIAAEKVRQEGPEVIEVLRPAEKVEKEKTGKTEKMPAPEHIGQVLATAEAIPIIQSEKAPEKATAKAEKIPEQITKPLIERRVETLNRAELLELSEKIVVDGSSLRQIYETHLIGEKGLRRLVGEHLRGGDLPKALRREIVEREIDFERDPAMRDMAPDGGAAGGTGGAHGRATLDHMLEKAGAKIDNSEEAAYYKARADYEARQHEQHKQQRQFIDVALGLVITGLLAAVAYLAFLRG